MPTFSRNLTGRIIAEARIQLLKKLGAGAFGEVYKAIDLSSTSKDPMYYAVKCLPRPALGSAYEQDVLNELNAQKFCDRHPNILNLHDVYVDAEEDLLFIVLDYAAAGDLYGAILGNYFAKETDLVKSVFSKILNAIEHCHSQGVAHCDLKPENILISEHGVRVADFGLAHFGQFSKGFGSGTRPYMAPEVFGTDSYYQEYDTFGADIWALGIVLIDMISVYQPWSKACYSDEKFCAFLDDPMFLRRQLRISYPAARLLKGIFRLNPLLRLSIAEIRRELLKIDTFFLRDGEHVEDPESFAPVVETFPTQNDVTVAQGCPLPPISTVFERLDFSYVPQAVPPTAYLSEGNHSFRGSQIKSLRYPSEPMECDNSMPYVTPTPGPQAGSRSMDEAPRVKPNLLNLLCDGGAGGL